MANSSAQRVHLQLTRLIVVLLIAAPLLSTAQDSTPVPVLTGGAAVVPTFSGGQFTLVNILSPVILVPLGDKFLVESRAAFEADYTRQQNGEFGGKVSKEIDYLQLDYIASRYATITVGLFLTPFGI